MSEENLIEFHGPFDQPFPRPFPAAQGAPAWLKDMPSDLPGGPGGKWLTFKKCPPLVDALTGGYLIPLAADVQFLMKEDGVEFRSDLKVIETHPQEQVRGSPVEGRVIVKFMNPWIVKTPPGYSTLFLQPLNRFELPFQVLSGIVETDTYFREVNFPSICLLRPGQSIMLRRGTPIAQIFPIRREGWTSQFVDTDMTRRQEFEKEFLGTVGHYKEKYWRRKQYE